MTRPRRDRESLTNPKVRVTVAIRLGEKRWVIEHRMDFSAIMAAAIHQLQIRDGGAVPEPVLEEPVEEAVASFLKERGAAPAPEDPRSWKAGELMLYGIWHNRQPPEVKTLPFEVKQDRFRAEMAEKAPSTAEASGAP